MAHAHCMLDATNTHSEYVMFIAFSTASTTPWKILNFKFICKLPGSTLLVAQLVEALRYKPEGRGFDSR
jgi:hypothetical protein